MTHAELKRRVGYVQPDFEETCGTCRNCTRRGCHLRCSKWGFAVVADGICRNGFEKLDAPLNEREAALLVWLKPEPMPLLLGYDPNLEEAAE